MLQRRVPRLARVPGVADPCLSLPCIMNKNLLRLLAAMESEKNDLWIVVLFLTSIDIKAYCKVSQPGAATPRESWCFGGSRRLS